MEKEGYQTLDDTAPAVELQETQPAVQQKDPEPSVQQKDPEPAVQQKEPAVQEKQDTAPPASPASAVAAAAEQPKESKQESKLEEKKQDVALALKNGYVPPGKPLRKFNRFCKGWAMLFFPIMLVQLGMCLIYISQAYSFVVAAFNDAAIGVQYLATSVVKQVASLFFSFSSFFFLSALSSKHQLVL